MPEKIPCAPSAEEKKILVVGGGTGLTTAYMLENMPGFKVTLVDTRDRLGGHIDSLYQYRRKDEHGEIKTVTCAFNLFEQDLIKGVVLDESQDSGYEVKLMLSNNQVYKKRILGEFEGGAEFIGNEKAYPNVHKLFEVLGVRLKEFQLNAHFHRLDKNVSEGDRDLFLPPLDEQYLNLGFFSFKMDTISLQLTDIKYLEGIYEAINASKRSEAPENEGGVMTLETFVGHLKERLQNNLLPKLTGLKVDDFAQRVLYPMLAAAWGVKPVSKIKTFCVHYAMNYLSLGTSWFDAVNGLSSYIAELKRRSDKLDVRLKTTILEIRPVDDNGSLKYKAFLGKDKDGMDLFLMDKNENIAFFDEVINTVPAEHMKNMLPQTMPDNIPDNKSFEKAVNDLKTALSSVEYYDTKVVFHTDEKYATDKNTIIHTRIETIDDEEYAANTACKKRLGKGPIMKTWVLAGQSMPEESKIVMVREYRHPVQDKIYFVAQQKLHDMMKKYGNQFGYRFGGILAELGDSHEDGITVALRNALAICEKYRCTANNARLAPFLKKVGNNYELLYNDNSQLSTQNKIEVANESKSFFCC